MSETTEPTDRVELPPPAVWISIQTEDGDFLPYMTAASWETAAKLAALVKPLGAVVAVTPLPLYPEDD